MIVKGAGFSDENNIIEVEGAGWNSKRLVLSDSRLGYSLHDTTMFAGTHITMHYTNHIESVYCIEGEAEVINEETGEKFTLRPGVIYILDNNDRHTFLAITQVRNICVFTPALTGNEVHDENGSYPLLDRQF